MFIVGRAGESEERATSCSISHSVAAPVISQRISTVDAISAALLAPFLNWAETACTWQEGEQGGALCCVLCRTFQLTSEPYGPKRYKRSSARDRHAQDDSEILTATRRATVSLNIFLGGGARRRRESGDRASVTATLQTSLAS